MEEENIKISPYRLKKFIFFLAKAQQEKERKQSHLNAINSNLKNIKKHIESKKTDDGSESVVYSETEDIIKNIHDILNKQNNLLKTQKNDEKILVDLKNKISSIEKEVVISDNKNTAEQIMNIKELSKINSSLEGISLGLKNEMNIVKDHENKIDELKKLNVEQKENIKKIKKADKEKEKTIKKIIKKESLKIKSLKDIELQLKDIEKKYNSLKTKDAKSARIKKLEKLLVKHKKVLNDKKEKYSSKESVKKRSNKPLKVKILKRKTLKKKK